MIVILKKVSKIYKINFFNGIFELYLKKLKHNQNNILYRGSIFKI